MDKSLCMLNNNIFVLSCYGQVVEDTTLFLGEIVSSLLVEDRVHGCLFNGGHYHLHSSSNIFIFQMQ